MQKSILRVGGEFDTRAGRVSGPYGTFIMIRRKFDGPPGEAAPTLGSAVLRGFGRGRTLAGPSYVYHRFFVIRCRGRRPRRPAIKISGGAATFLRRRLRYSRCVGPAGCPARTEWNSVARRVGRAGLAPTGALNAMQRECGGPPGEAAPTTLFDGFSGIRNAGRPGVRPVRNGIRWHGVWAERVRPVRGFPLYRIYGQPAIFLARKMR